MIISKWLDKFRNVNIICKFKHLSPIENICACISSVKSSYLCAFQCPVKNIVFENHFETNVGINAYRIF